MWKVDKGSQTGITTDSYSDALDWQVEELREKTILLKNSDQFSSLKYRLVACAVPDGIISEEISESTLSAGQVVKIQFVRQWAKLVLQVSDGSGHASYQVDYIGQGA